MSNLFKKIGENQIMHKLQQLEAALVHADLMLATLRAYVTPPAELEKRIAATLAVASKRPGIQIPEVQAELERVARQFALDPESKFEPFPTMASPSVAPLTIVDEPAADREHVQSAYEAAVAAMDATAETPA